MSDAQGGRLPEGGHDEPHASPAPHGPGARGDTQESGGSVAAAAEDDDREGGNQGQRPICHACGNQVPPGVYCAVCGAHLERPTSAGTLRRDAFAARPNEHVLVPWVLSTLLPHLPHRRQALFRVALVLVVVLLALFGLLRLTAPAIAFSAAAVPVLYFLYLWEVQVYEDDPLLAAGLLVVGGLVLGFAWARLTGTLITTSSLASTVVGVAPKTLLGLGVLLPIVQEIVMLVPSLAVFVVRGRRFDEALDGFTFGAAGALGFTLAATLVDLVPELQAGQISTVDPLVNVVEILQRGFLSPVVNASTAGLIAAALWLLRGRRRPEVHHLVASLPGTAAIALVAQIVVALVGQLTPLPWLIGLTYLVVAGILFVAVRLALHHMLLAEAVEVVEEGPPFPCPHCHHLVPRLAFCPNCGVAVRATAKVGQGRTGRAIR